MSGKKNSKRNIPKLQRKADASALSIKNGLANDIRNDTDYDNRNAEANRVFDAAAKKEI